ncbi:MAG: SDR family oxidoreductase [Chitinophagaceae bacterium]|nr:SDR family oxidoreductase [Chitinophagaceae bacterium]
MNKVILITGGSRGIGAATALLAAKKGYDVCINYLRNEAAAAQVVAAVKNEGRNAVAIQADVSNASEVTRLFKEFDKAFGRLDGLVNNAGILETQMKVLEMSPGRLERVFSANVFSTFYCSIEAVRRMSTHNGGNGGSIVNLSSVASRTGSPNEYVDYAAAKGAIDTFTIGLAKEVAVEGIRVNAVRPGFIYTDIHASGGEPNRVDRVKEMVPMKRGGYPEEVAGAIVWLLSGEASFTSGAFIDVAGGR